MFSKEEEPQSYCLRADFVPLFKQPCKKLSDVFGYRICKTLKIQPSNQIQIRVDL